MSTHDTWHSSVFTNILAWVCSIVFWDACLLLYNGLQVDSSVHIWHLTLCSCILKCKHLALVISTLKLVFPLRTKMQDYHLMYLNVLLQISWCRCFFRLNFFLCWRMESYWQLVGVPFWDLYGIYASSLGYVTLNTINGVLQWLTLEIIWVYCSPSLVWHLWETQEMSYYWGVVLSRYKNKIKIWASKHI